MSLCKTGFLPAQELRWLTILIQNADSGTLDGDPNKKGYENFPKCPKQLKRTVRNFFYLPQIIVVIWFTISLAGLQLSPDCFIPRWRKNIKKRNPRQCRKRYYVLPVCVFFLYADSYTLPTLIIVRYSVGDGGIYAYGCLYVRQICCHQHDLSWPLILITNSEWQVRELDQ